MCKLIYHIVFKGKIFFWVVVWVNLQDIAQAKIIVEIKPTWTHEESY